MTDERDFTAYVTARWAQLVRCLVAMGAPLGIAHDAVGDALSRCHDEWDDRDEWADLDVHVVRDLFERWDHRRDDWWAAPVPEADAEALEDAGWPALEERLDPLTPEDRRALVVSEVLGMGPDQVRAIAGTETRHQSLELAGQLHEVLDLLPVDPPPLEAMAAASRQRRRRRRTVSIGAVAVLVLVGALVTVLAVRHEEPAEGVPPERFASVRSVPYDNPSPVAWYSGGTLYLPHSQLALRDVRQFAQWRDGAVYLDVRGNLLTVSAKGDRARITTLGSTGTFGVLDEQDDVVWIDPRGPELVVHDLVEGTDRLTIPLNDAATRIVDVDGRTAYLETDVQLLTADLRSGDLHVVPDERMEGEIDRYKGYALAREGPSEFSQIRLYELKTGEPVPLLVDGPEAVSDARFGSDGSVMLLIEPESRAQISEVRRCPPPYQECRTLAIFPTGGARPLLAS